MDVLDSSLLWSFTLGSADVAVADTRRITAPAKISHVGLVTGWLLLVTSLWRWWR